MISWDDTSHLMLMEELRRSTRSGRHEQALSAQYRHQRDILMNIAVPTTPAWVQRANEAATSQMEDTRTPVRWAFKLGLPWSLIPVGIALLVWLF